MLHKNLPMRYRQPMLKEKPENLRGRELKWGGSNFCPKSHTKGGDTHSLFSQISCMNTKRILCGAMKIWGGAAWFKREKNWPYTEKHTRTGRLVWVRQHHWMSFLLLMVNSSKTWREPRQTPTWKTQRLRAIRAGEMTWFVLNSLRLGIMPRERV